ncbi:MAG: hypothetical protein AAGF87_18290 [Bacteroidota bacterium]
MKYFVLSSLLLVSLVFSCGNDDDGAEPAMDLTVQAVGSYSGDLEITSAGGNIGAFQPDETAAVTKVSNTEISIAMLTNDDFWDPLTIRATMSSETAFTFENVSWEGFTFGGSGVISGNTMTLTFNNGGTGTYVGTK